MTDQEKIYRKFNFKRFDIPVFIIDDGLDGITEILQNKFYEN